MSKPDYYPFSTSAVESVRLNAQQRIWRAALGYNLHPSITENHTGDVSIAEVACGTCAWLLEVVQEPLRTNVTSVNLTGLDINLSHCPPQAWLPSNLRVKHWDIFTPPSDDLKAFFDIIHVRLLCCVIRTEENIQRVLANFLALLKPGGHLQWDEENIFEPRIHRANPAIATPALEQLVIVRKPQAVMDWLEKVPSVLSSSGFVDVKVYNHWSCMEMARAETDTTIMSMQQYCEGFMRDDERRLEEMRKLFGDAFEEAVKGAALCTAKGVFVARKGEE